jgi:hypothetical protein
MGYKLALLILLQMLMVSATLRSTDLRGRVINKSGNPGSPPSGFVGIPIGLFEARRDGTFAVVRQTNTGPNGIYYLAGVPPGAYVLQIDGVNYPLGVENAPTQDIPIITIQARLSTTPSSPTSGPDTAGEHTYRGKVGPYDATFQLRFEGGERVSGTYTMDVDNGLVLRLEGRNPSGKLFLEEYTRDKLTAHIELTLKNAKGEIRWEGNMQNTPPDNRTFPVFFSRSGR